MGNGRMDSMAVIIAPAPKPKTLHMAKHINQQGEVSPLCAPKPRALDLKKAGWTNRKEAVTCPKCLALLKQS